jgi:perosamine synthetase
MSTEHEKVPLTRPYFDDEEMRMLKQCLDSGWVTQGPMVKRFEELIAARHQVKYALTVTSCTAALHLAALALGLRAGDEAIVPAFTWVTSANCVEYTGAKAVFADIEPGTFNLDPAAFEAAITPQTKAVVVVHLFGLAARMDEILAVAKRHNLRVIEDAACAIGTAYDGRPVGGIGDIGCFSFHPRKVVTTGEGGAVTTNDDNLAKMVMSLRCHGDSIFFLPPDPNAGKPYTMDPFDNLGYNYRLSDIQAAVGVAQMTKLEELLAERKGWGERYNRLLADLPDLALPIVPPKCGHTYQSYVVRVKEGGVERRNRIMDALTAGNIQSRPGTHAVHRLGYYQKKYDLRPEMFPNACLGEDTTITLPIFPGMTEDDQDFVVNALRQAM